MPRKSSPEFITARGGYITYCSGIAMLQTPEKMQPMHFRSPETEKDEIVDHASIQIVNGLRTIMLVAANRQGMSGLYAVDRKKAVNTVVAEASSIVDEVCEDPSAAQQLTGLNQLFPVRRPFALAEPTIARQFCHSNYGAILVSATLDGFNPDRTMLAAVQGRTLPTPTQVQPITAPQVTAS